MRPLEILSGTGLMVFAVIALRARSWRTAAMVAAILAMAAIVGHLWLEGPRLQAAPLYFAILPALVLVSSVGSWQVRWLAAAGVGGAAIAGLMLCYAIPVFELPPVRGPYAIGSTTLAFTDHSREEANLPVRGQPRRFMAEIWYPASDCAGPRAAYRDLRTIRSWKSAHLKYIKTHSCVDAPALVSESRWPIIFFSPSSGGYRSQNTFLVEELASHGYVVVGMDHPYSCSRVAFPDGSVVYLDGAKNTWLNLANMKAWRESTPRVERMLDTNIGDIQFTYEQMKQGRVFGKAAEVARAVDFERAAVIGHSFGGAAAVELCRTDPRFIAGINLDGWMLHDFHATGVDKPFLFVIEDDPLWFKNEGPYDDDLHGMEMLGTKDYHDSIRASVRRWGGYILRLQGANHFSFADLGLYLRWPLGGGGVNPETVLVLTRKFALAFFDRYLQGKDAEALENSVVTAGYELQVFPGPSLSAVKRAASVVNVR